MKIKIRIEREENAKYYKCNIGDIVEEDLETYVAGVTASEMPERFLHASAAQAICARTRAYNKILSNTPISDLSTKDQAYRTSRIGYVVAAAGTALTEGMIITYNGKVIDTCVYSANNGGTVVSAKERWGSERPYLLAFDDAYDTSTTRKGHGVGMSQLGAINIASEGYGYQNILAYYFIGTEIATIGGDNMAKKIKVNDLIDLFEVMLKEHWSYTWGGASKGNVDCSGAFVYAFKQLGGPALEHSSNRIPRKNCSAIRTDLSTAKPGDVAVKRRDATGDIKTKYGKNDFYHMGLVDRSGKYVLNAKSSTTGFSLDPISSWYGVCELNDVEYDNAQPEVPTDYLYMATITTNSTNLRVRSGPSTNADIVGHVDKGDIVYVVAETGNWREIVTLNGSLRGYSSADYITPTSLTTKEEETKTLSSTDSSEMVTISIPRSELEEIYKLIGFYLS